MFSNQQIENLGGMVFSNQQIENLGGMVFSNQQVQVLARQSAVTGMEMLDGTHGINSWPAFIEELSLVYCR